MNTMEKNKDLIEVIDLGITLAEETFKILEDGKIGFTDFDNVLKIYKKVEPALEDIGKAKASLSALSESEAKEINAYFQKEFDLPNDYVETCIEAAVEVALNLGKLFSFFKKK
jgi:hypothetical protein